jgi:glycosyltransferase involved in cell wall biosynthesis
MNKVIFNQNCFYTFNGFSIDQSLKKCIYTNSKLLHTIVVSKNSKDYLNYTFPNLNVDRITLGIDSNKFYFDKNVKKNQIAFMPRKLEDDITQLLNILKYRNCLKNWDLVTIENKSEDEVATILNESKIFLSFYHREGFGLPPAEAMSSGCLVIGYTGKAGKEYFLPNITFPIIEGEIIKYAKELESLLLNFDNEKTLEIGKQASEFIHNTYNFKNEKDSVISVWNKILSKTE